MDYRNFICFDFETSSTDTSNTQILQIGACAINRNSLKIMDRFESLVKPDDFDTLEQGALDVNGLTVEQLKDAPEVSIVFPSFVKWIQKYNTNKDKNSFGAPIPVYYGGDGFDMPIMNRYCKRFGHWDKKWGNQTVLNPIFSFDVMRHMWFWTRGNKEVKNNKLVTILAYMGVSEEEIARGAHDALWDVYWTAQVAIRLLKVCNYLTDRDKESGNRRLEFADRLKGVGYDWK